MNLFLVHGMGRSRLSLLPLAGALRRAGHQASIFGYSVARRHFDENAQRLLAHIKANDEGRPFGIVAHSLGGILTRAISPQLSGSLQRFVMLGPPNRPVVMAKKLSKNPVYRSLTGISGQHLGSEDFYARLPIPQTKTLVVAGCQGRADRWSPFDGKENDGIVSVEETRLEGAEHLVVPSVHTWLMNDRRARAAILSFLT